MYLQRNTQIIPSQRKLATTFNSKEGKQKKLMNSQSTQEIQDQFLSPKISSLKQLKNLSRDNFDCFILNFENYLNEIEQLPYLNSNQNQNFLHENDQINYSLILHKNENYEIKSKNLNPLYFSFYTIFCQIWMDIQINKNYIQNYSQEDKNFIKILLQKKFHNSINTTSNDQFYFNLNQLNKTKILEKDQILLECLLTKVFNFIQKVIYKNIENSLEKIYQDFFIEIISLKSFKQNFSQINSNSQKFLIKQINQNTIKILKKSKQFCSLLITYCQCFIQDDFSSNIKKNFLSLFNKIQKEFKFQKEISKQICKFIESDLNPKFPFTFKEMNHAIKITYNKFNFNF